MNGRRGSRVSRGEGSYRASFRDPIIDEHQSDKVRVRVRIRVNVTVTVENRVLPCEL